MASVETIHVLKEALVELTLGRSDLKIFMLDAEITNEIILRLDVLWADDASVDLECRTPRLDREVVSLCRHEARPRSSKLPLSSDEVIPDSC
jgi:hypothetical protein